MSSKPSSQTNACEGNYSDEQPRTARDVIRYGVLKVKPDTPVYEAITQMLDGRVTGLPVVDDDMKVVGMITEKDLLSLLYCLGRGAGKVEDYMTREIVCCGHDDDLSKICEALVNNSFRRVPVIDDSGKLLSVISRADIIRVNRHRFCPQGFVESSRRKGLIAIAKHAMKKGLITVEPTGTIYDATNILVENGITGLPIVKGDMQLLGVVSEKDILKLLYNNNSKPEYVDEIMTRDVCTFSPEDSLIDICRCLLDYQFRRVPIVENGRLVGIVSRTDIITYILRHQASGLRRAVKSSPTVTIS